MQRNAGYVAAAVLSPVIYMAMVEVYLVDAGKGVPIAEKLETLLEKVGNGLWSNLKGDIALKMHVGAQNNETFIKPFT